MTKTAAGLAPDQRVEFFRFYEEAAEKVNASVWTQTAWILTLNVGGIAFSIDLYVEHANHP